MGYKFPDPNSASEEGLVAIGGDLSLETLYNAYSNGIFPWPMSADQPLLWFSLNPRGVLFCDELHISRSMKKLINKNKYKVVFNNNFEAVIEKCAHIKRKDQSDTWIDQRIENAYVELFNNKKAYCVEVYNKDYKLVAGLYGVCFGELVSGESMFHEEDNTSKLAVISLITQLRSKGIKFIDTQMVTSVVASLGAIELERKDFIEMIKKLDLTKDRDQIFKL